MSLLRTRRFRLAAVCLAAVLVAGGLLALYSYRQWQQDERARGQRDAARLAFEAGEYPVAIGHMRQYLTQHPNDVGALFLLAQARLNAAPLDRQQTDQAIGTLRRILHLEPGHESAKRALLVAYAAADDATAALRLADEILTNAPSDPHALRAKALALEHSGRHGEALPVAEAYLQVNPSDLKIWMLVLDIEHGLDGNPRSLVARAEAIRARQPDDPRGDLLQAYAHRLANEPVEAADWLRKAASRPPPDALFSTTLVRLLDEAQLFSESLVVLEREARDRSRVGAGQEFVRRLWESGRYAEVNARVSQASSEAGQVDTELLAMRALSLSQLGRHTEALALIATIEDRKGEPRSAAWASVLASELDPTRQPSAQVLQVSKRALDADPQSAYFADHLARAYAQFGEHSFAVKYWQLAIQCRPIWLAPRLRLVCALLEQGHAEEALREADAMHALAPDNNEVALMWVLARAANLESRSASSAGQLLEILANIERTAADDERTIPLRASLLTFTGAQEEARQTLRAALARAKPLSESALLHLAETSRELDLGVEEACYAQSEQRYGTTPHLVLDRAAHLLAQGQSSQVLPLVEISHSAGPNHLEWQIVHARLLDQLHDPRAKETWIALVDKYPQDIHVQRAALSARAVSSEAKFLDRTIERLRSLTGEEAVTWRMQRADWLLRFATSERNRAKATAILEDIVSHFPTLVEARILLARSLHELGYVEPAINELAIADQLQPRSSLVALELAWLYQQKNDLQHAQMYVARAMHDSAHRGVNTLGTARRLAESDHAGAAGWLPSQDAREHIARYAHRLLADGRTDQAAELLEPLLEESRSWRAAWMGLAALAVRDPDVAAQWLERVGQHIPQDVPHERLALAQTWATLAIRSNRSELRKTAREKLEQVLELPQASAEIWFIRGALAERDHELELAASSYHAALKRDPDLHTAKNNLAMMLAAKKEDLQEALDLAQAAVNSLPTRADYLDTLSFVQAKMKDYDQAIANMKAAVELQPDQPKWKTRLAKILAEAGRKNEADQVLKELEARPAGDG